MSLLRRLAFLLTLLSLLGLAGAAHATNAGEVIGEAEYWQLVAESQQTVRELGKADAGQAAARLAPLAARWQAVEAVQFENGQQMRVDNSAWATLMRTNPVPLEQLDGLLTALLAERETLQPAGPDSSQALRLLQEVLARDEFQWRSQTPSWLQNLWDRLMAWLDHLFGNSDTVTITIDGGGLDVLTIIAFTLIFLLLAYTLRGLFADLVSESTLETEAAHDEPLSARTALNRADTLSRQGDYRSAVRYLYLSALLILDERGLLYYDRTKTNREYLRQVAGNPAIAGLLREVIHVFDRVWYGFQPMDEATYQRYAAQVRELEQLP
jgi:hypothetical protein